MGSPLAQIATLVAEILSTPGSAAQIRQLADSYLVVYSQCGRNISVTLTYGRARMVWSEWSQGSFIIAEQDFEYADPNFTDDLAGRMREVRQT